MRLKVENRLPQRYDTASLYLLLREFAQQINGVTEGSVQAITNGVTAAPTTGSYKQGDVLRKTDLTEAGASPNKYIVIGYACTASGTPGTWKELRCLTGN